jgi:hypothetical protein
MSNRQERNESVAGRGSEKRKKEGKKGRAQKEDVLRLFGEHQM